MELDFITPNLVVSKETKFNVLHWFYSLLPSLYMVFYLYIFWKIRWRELFTTCVQGSWARVFGVVGYFLYPIHKYWPQIPIKITFKSSI